MELYIIAGPNGAGKTTFAREFSAQLCRLQELREC
jgi:predicted ABC-type ATPase